MKTQASANVHFDLLFFFLPKTPFENLGATWEQNPAKFLSTSLPDVAENQGGPRVKLGSIHSTTLGLAGSSPAATFKTFLAFISPGAR